MLKTIWKSTLDINLDVYEVNLPIGAEILSVHKQYNKPTIWALVDSTAQLEKRNFVVYGTGHAILIDTNSELKFVGTVLCNNDNEVWHIFEKLTIKN